MSNMSYCRFENTLADLRDCFDNMDDQDLSDREQVQRDLMIKVCCEIAEDYGEDVE